MLKILMNSLDPDQAQIFFVPELGLKPLVKFISRHLLCRHTFHMKYSVFAFSDIKEK